MEPLRLHDAIAVIPAHPRAAVLIAFILCAAAIDARTHRVPNWLNASVALAGLAFAFSGMTSGPQWRGALAGCAAGLVLMLPPYAVRTMGAGDVKLMAAIGTFLGMEATAYAVLFTFIAGGLLALAWSAWHRNLGRLAANLHMAAASSLRVRVSEAASVGRMPYACAICIGTLAAIWLRRPFGT